MTGMEMLKLYEAGYATVKKNLEGVSHEESMRGPTGGGNCANWVLGHLVSTRLALLGLVGAEPVGSPEIHHIYDAQEDAPAFDPARALPMEQLLALFDESQERLRAALPHITDERLAAPALLGTVGDTVAFLTFHEGYHCGQLGVLRRTLGKPGKIKPPKRPLSAAPAQ